MKLEVILERIQNFILSQNFSGSVDTLYFCQPALGIAEVLSIQKLSNDLFVKDVYHVIDNFHVDNQSLSYDGLKISVALIIFLKHNILTKFPEILLNNNVTSPHTVIRWQSNNHYHVFHFISSNVLLKVLCHKNIFKKLIQELKMLLFLMINEINRNY